MLSLALLINYCKAAAISLRHLLKSFDKGNLYFGPLQIIHVDQILKSVIIFKCPAFELYGQQVDSSKLIYDGYQAE